MKTHLRQSQNTNTNAHMPFLVSSRIKFWIIPIPSSNSCKTAAFLCTFSFLSAVLSFDEFFRSRQRATETAKNLQNAASSSVVAAQAKVSVLSDTMVSELQKIHVSAFV